jgi:hypothetical protein
MVGTGTGLLRGTHTQPVPMARVWWVADLQEAVQVVAMENTQSPSKTSLSARFRGWWDGGYVKQTTTFENEYTRSFSRVVVTEKDSHLQK